jgi:AraC-like DNA-binding protein
MDKAKELLSGNEELPLSEIAAQCGFHDYNYFITVFSREGGCSPAAWRRAQ